ncbi:MAG: molybdopterin-dependent oxidoreductase, partial [Nitrospira sp.]|nr:molybdopterin-dependent oxidoreductase [Nitrospira sp.]
SVDDQAARAIKGVRDVIKLDEGCVAVVADTYWQAKKGADALNITYDGGQYANLDSHAISQMFQEGLKENGAVARNEGNVDEALRSAAKTVEAMYEVPFLNHASLESMTSTAYVTSEGCDIWAPTQAQHLVHDNAAKITGLPLEKIKIHTTYLGCGFGRKLEMDFIAQALKLSMKAGKPVKVVWSREEDMQHGHYRPAFLSKLVGGLDDKGKPIAFWQKNVGPAIYIGTGTKPAIAAWIVDSEWTKNQEKSGVDYPAVEGAIENAYGFSNLKLEYVRKDTPVPLGYWRSVGNSQNGFFIESFMDELAHAGGHDPYRMRRELLSHKPRYQAVLDLVAEKSDWDKPLPAGRYRGLALHMSFETIVGQVVEISMVGDDKIKIHRVVVALDCGTVINPQQVEAQMQSGIAFGLTAAVMGENTLKDGRIVQSNFHDYEILHMAQMPPIEVYMVQNQEAPGGIGEPGVPPLAPALTNAISAATGKRIRTLPLSKHGFSLA